MTYKSIQNVNVQPKELSELNKCSYISGQEIKQLKPQTSNPGTLYHNKVLFPSHF